MSTQDELTHQILHIAQQQVGRLYFVLFGHIADYFPETNTVTVLLVSFTADTGIPQMTGQIPLGTSWSGYGWGLQAAPLGGSTAENPFVGEPCMVVVLERETGLMAVGAMLYGGFNNTPDPLLKNGEFIIKHRNGNLIKFHDSGELEITLPAPSAVLDITVNGPVNVVSEGPNASANVTSSGPASVTSTTALVKASESAAITSPSIQLGNGGELQALMQETALQVFNEHTHYTPNGVSSVPIQQMTSDDLTEIVAAQ